MLFKSKYTMKQFYLLIIIYFFSITCSGNTCVISGKVLNNNMEELQYVSIGVINKTIGTVSDKNGNFELNINENQLEPYDSLKFSMIGYYSKTFLLSELVNKKALTIILKEKAEKIPEARIIGNKIKTKIKGTTHFPVPLYVRLTDSTKQNQNLGSAIARSFNINHDNTQIENIRFFVYSNYDTITIRISFYSIKKRKPYKPILNEGVYVKMNGVYHDWVSVDLKKYNIVVSDDIIIGIEWVGKSKKGDYLFFPLARPSSAHHYYKVGSQNKWERWPHMSCLMEVMIKY